MKPHKPTFRKCSDEIFVDHGHSFSQIISVGISDSEIESASSEGIDFEEGYECVSEVEEMLRYWEC
jgi:hypothetical protein